ncbi:unnamed protein product [Adineta ricciae]|uniref:Uncharacterized protein n=1 Tax=Adineta ricciae TaxID=249248 RepID=A0A813TCP4_ADIRI|nr:unnamed protein product [Adineta ricciae]
MPDYRQQAWKESVCDCFHDGQICCYGCWCCCCLYGENVAKLENNSRCFTHCCVYTLLSMFGCCCLIHSAKRARLRQRYGLVEDACGDCFITCCCPACAICQEAREMKMRGCPAPPLIVIHQPAMSLSSAADFDTNH